MQFEKHFLLVVCPQEGRGGGGGQGYDLESISAKSCKLLRTAEKLRYSAWGRLRENFHLCHHLFQRHYSGKKERRRGHKRRRERFKERGGWNGGEWTKIIERFMMFVQGAMLLHSGL